MRGRTWTVVLCAGLMLVATPGAHADNSEATQKDFWTAAGQLATATIYAPSTATLKKLKLIYDDSAGETKLLQLRMLCQGQWNVESKYGDLENQFSAPSLQIYQSTKSCADDPPAFEVPPNRSTVKVAGVTIGIDYQGCLSSGSYDVAEEKCPAGKRSYGASGALPAAGGKEPNYFQLYATHLSRAEVKTILRSLRPAG